MEPNVAGLFLAQTCFCGDFIHSRPRKLPRELISKQIGLRRDRGNEEIYSNSIMRIVISRVHIFCSLARANHVAE